MMCRSGSKNVLKILGTDIMYKKATFTELVERRLISSANEA